MYRQVSNLTLIFTTNLIIFIRNTVGSKPLTTFIILETNYFMKVSNTLLVKEVCVEYRKQLPSAF